jgi:hypothetical protein
MEVYIKIYTSKFTLATGDALMPVFIHAVFTGTKLKN